MSDILQNMPNMPPQDPQKIEMRREDYLAIQNQMANLQNQITVAQSIAVREKTRADEITQVAQRLQADFDNFRKRNIEINKKAKDEGVTEVLIKLLPHIDVVEKAIKLITDETVADGVRIILRKMLEMLATYNVTEIIALGQPFDPELHNAIEHTHATDPAQSGTVVEVFQSGYRQGDKILRHSLVKVAM